MHSLRQVLDNLIRTNQALNPTLETTNLKASKWFAMGMLLKYFGIKEITMDGIKVLSRLYQMEQLNFRLKGDGPKTPNGQWI
jgi:hypothetical protein